MFQTLRTPLTNLQRAAELWPTATAFKVPILDGTKAPVDPHISGYIDITFQQFHADVESAAAHWQFMLIQTQVGPGKVVALCLRGYVYTDLVHIYGLMRAGYIPQMFTTLPGTVEAVASLLTSGGAKALVCAEDHLGLKSIDWISRNMDLKVFPDASLDVIRARASTPGATANFQRECSGDDVAMIVHTSGSTSGLPKHVEWSHHFLDAIVAKAPAFCVPIEDGRQDVCSSWGPVCHVGTFSFMLSQIYHGSCTVMKSTAALSTPELKVMITLGGITRAIVYPVVLSRLIRECHGDLELLGLVKKLDVIMTGGGSVHEDEWEFVQKNGIKLLNHYGCTESGNMLLSNLHGHPNHLSPIQIATGDVRYQFISVDAGLKELVVLPESGDCPPPYLCDKNTGIHHTGDLFTEVTPGEYLHRGRSDDWLKTTLGKCDAG
ncbi:hypothetical protein V5O48_014519 [Marasmius crinis-equi]|uniref:AMP-dependent synthetase/ligase domain-containing protein n=1 Tax=Marasmius crinis-equi TaxID=585013 RepID=A0ABR3EX33_9AGAR